MKKTLMITLMLGGMLGMSLSSTAGGTTECDDTEEECTRILIGNHVYIHYGLKSENPQIN